MLQYKNGTHCVQHGAFPVEGGYAFGTRQFERREVMLIIESRGESDKERQVAEFVKERLRIGWDYS